MNFLLVLFLLRVKCPALLLWLPPFSEMTNFYTAEKYRHTLTAGFFFFFVKSAPSELDIRKNMNFWKRISIVKNDGGCAKVWVCLISKGPGNFIKPNRVMHLLKYHAIVTKKLKLGHH